MKMYQLHSTLFFGKYKGKPLRTVFEENPSYIDWCLREHGNFCISKAAFRSLKNVNPIYQFSTDAIKRIDAYGCSSKPISTYSDDYVYNYKCDHITFELEAMDHPVLRERDDACRLISEAEAIGCDVEDLISNLD